MGTMTSAFLLTLQFECALTIFLTVARGYSFCPGMLKFDDLDGSGLLEGKAHQQRLWVDFLVAGGRVVVLMRMTESFVDWARARKSSQPIGEQASEPLSVTCATIPG
jgi:hypothetical protein